MNTANRFGFLGLILSLLIYLSLLNMVIAQEQYKGFSYLVYADLFSNDTAVLKNITAKNIDPSFFPSTDTGYRIRVYSYNGSSLFEDNLAVSFEVDIDIAPGQGIPSGMPIAQRLDKIPLFVRVPGRSDVTRISIHHEGRNILDINLSKELCNRNKICDLGENEYTCSDCNGSDSLAGYNQNWIVFIIAIVFFVVMGILFWKWHKYKGIESS
jgi:hypothetical protein